MCKHLVKGCHPTELNSDTPLLFCPYHDCYLVLNIDKILCTDIVIVHHVLQSLVEQCPADDPDTEINLGCLLFKVRYMNLLQMTK